MEVEAACKEDEEQRAGRFIDWVTSRISRRSDRWVKEVEKLEDNGKGLHTPNEGRTPWWEELRKCTEGDLVPLRSEGWNHPVSSMFCSLIEQNFYELTTVHDTVIYAVSTNTPNPLQVLQNLTTRQTDLPSWVDSVRFLYVLVIHTETSLLSDDE